MIYGEQVVEVIKDGQIMKVSLSQAEDEELFILNRPGLNADPIEGLKDNTLDLTLPKVSEKEIMKNKISSALIDNFHWKILRVRREKGISRKQFAEKIGETEALIKKVEYGEIPDSNFII